MLNKIVATKKVEVDNIQVKEPINVTRVSLVEALLKPNRKIGLIAEIKKASPSKGIIKHDFNPVEIALQYEAANADALSVLTDETYFQGHHTFLSAIKDKVKLPVLRKDFIIDRRQIDESVAIGADAILLIATILEQNQLYEFYLEAYERGLECLVEIHSLTDLEKVITKFTPKIVGINNRDLKTFMTDINNTLHIATQLPKDVVIVSESGIMTNEDLNIISSVADAVLIGEAFMRSKTPQAGIEALFNE